MSGSERSASRGRGLGKLKGWLVANRSSVAGNIFAGLAVAAILWGGAALAEFNFGRELPGWVALAAASAGFVAGAVSRQRRLRTQSRLATRREMAIKEGEKSTAYMEMLRAGLRDGLGQRLDLEADLLLRPGELIKEMLGVTLRFAILVPVEFQADARWRVLHQVGISKRERREFEVPLRNSYLAWIQPEWKPDEVFYIDDLCEQSAGAARAGKDLEAFVRAGYRALRCVRIESPTPTPTSACLLVLCKEKIPASRREDAFLSSISRLLSAHFELVGMWERVEALERRLGKGGEQ